MLELRRQKRDSLYDIQTQKPRILVTRDKRLEVSERVRFDGSIHTPLDEEEVRAAARKLKAQGITTVAVCFLFSFIEPAHEKRVKEILAEEMPGAFVSISHEVAPEFREYERLSTTVVNAYLGPIMKSYLSKLQPRLAEIGIEAHPHLTQSNGGVISSEVAQNFPARTVLSGPAAGVIGALSVGGLAGFDNVITFDMGGTSTDVSLIDRGRPQMSNDAVVHGYPLKLPMLDIHTVGAGGGSLAAIDSGGLLKVGPRSAGADPGPVCYGRGATEPAVTDANVVLQTLNPTHLLGGRMPIDQSLSKQAIGRLADELGLDLMATAQGIISVVTANMATAIRVISVQRGHDPRDYALVAFGGAGPLHAARLARELDMKRIVVPRNPGIGCALGLLLTDLRANFATTRLATLSDALVPDMAEIFVALQEQADHWFTEEGVASADRRLKRTADLRYHGQNYELAIDVPDGPITPATITALAEGFAAAHKRLYGFVAEGEAVQLVTYRVEAVGLVPKAAFRPEPDDGPDASHAIIGSREVWFPEAGGFVACPIYDRDKLKSGNRFAGPAIVEQMDSTTVLLPDMTATVEPYLNLILEMP